MIASSFNQNGQQSVARGWIVHADSPLSGLNTHFSPLVALLPSRLKSRREATCYGSVGQEPIFIAYPFWNSSDRRANNRSSAEHGLHHCKRSSFDTRRQK